MNYEYLKDNLRKIKPRLSERSDVFFMWLTVFKGNTLLVKDSLIYLNSVQKIHTKNPLHYFTPIYFSTVSHWRGWLPSSYEWVWTLTRVMALFWKAHNSAPAGNEYDRTTIVNTELWLQETFCLVTNLSLAFIQYYGETKSVWTIAHFSAMWVCVCTWIIVPSDNTCQWQVPLWYEKWKVPLKCLLRGTEWKFTNYVNTSAVLLLLPFPLVEACRLHLCLVIIFSRSTLTKIQ